MNFGFQSPEQKFMEFHTVWGGKNSSRAGGEKTFVGNVFPYLSERFSRSHFLRCSGHPNARMWAGNAGAFVLSLRPAVKTWRRAQPRRAQRDAVHLSARLSSSSSGSPTRGAKKVPYWLCFCLRGAKAPYLTSCWACFVEIMSGVFLKIHKYLLGKVDHNCHICGLSAERAFYPNASPCVQSKPRKESGGLLPKQLVLIIWGLR